MVPDAKTILIADDDKLVLATYKAAFERQGHKVLLAENGYRAIAHLEKNAVDIVFLDILMPEKEGLETLLELRKRFPSIPVYVISGGGSRSRHDFLTTAQKFGATGVIRKPVTAAALLKLIEETSLESGRTGAEKTA